VSEQGVQEGTKHAPLRGPRVEGKHGECVVAYLHHLGEAPQEVQEVFSPRVLSLVMSLEGTMVLNAEL
jgi:hypothetical protein